MIKRSITDCCWNNVMRGVSCYNWNGIIL